ncbi:uncharacterized protein TNCV_2385451 [Trichonephila clavipes]|nr:uncharacterized protein TNCV_2385451 [Trichonephila clavipes]
MIGQMVLIKEDFLPINTWPLGRILEVYHGSDGKVRVVKVKTQSGEFKRAISKIAVLLIDTKVSVDCHLPRSSMVSFGDRFLPGVANVVRAPFDYVGNQKRKVLLPEGVGEKGFLESRSPTFRIDSSRKDMRRTGFEGPDWKQKA